MQLHKTTGRWRLGFTLALVAAATWGLLPVVLKVVLGPLDPYTVTWFRFTASGAALLPILALKGDLKEMRKIRPPVVLLLAVAAVFLCANYITYVLGLDRLSPESTQVVIQLAPMFLLLGSIVVFSEKFCLPQWGGVGVFSAGLVLFFHERLGELLFSLTDFKVGVLLIAFSSLLWAVYALAQKQLLKNLPSGLILFLVYIVGCIIFLPISHPLRIGDLDGPRLIALLLCALNTLVAYGAFVEALNHWDATRVSATLTIVPVVTFAVTAVGAALLPSLVTRQPLDGLSILGAVAVVGGSMLASLWQSGKKGC
jgi:drug/metabolite transporter (DMT)-like permease